MTEVVIDTGIVCVNHLDRMAVFLEVEGGPFLTPEQARLVAEALMEAAELAEEFERAAGQREEWSA